MKKSLIALFIFFSVSVHSQITLHFKDTISKKPSAYVMVFNESKEIIGTSNEIGEIYLEKNNKLTNKIFIESIFYEKKEIITNKLENNAIILLEPKVNLLDEVEIDDKNKFIVLTAYYRIYNSIDDVLNSYVDAEVKYIIKKNSIQKKVLNFRIFDTISSKDYNLSKRNFYWVDELEKTSLFETLNSKFYLIKDDEKGLISIVGKKSNKVYGTIKSDFNNINNKSNIVIDITNETDNIIGIAREEYKNEELLKTTIKDLKYWSRINIRTVTPKYIKINPYLKGKEKMFNKREIFIQNFEYVNKEEYKKIMKLGYKDKSISHYTKKFWKNLEVFTPLDPLIESQIKTILVERK